MYSWKLCFLLVPCKGVIRWPIEARIDSWKGAAFERGLELGSRGIAIVRSRYQETSSNRLRTLMCVTVICKVRRSTLAF
jgi:hypothetical protein